MFKLPSFLRFKTNALVPITEAGLTSRALMRTEKTGVPTLNDQLLDAVRSGEGYRTGLLLDQDADPLATYSLGYNPEEAASLRNAAHYNAIQGNKTITDLLLAPEYGLNGRAVDLAHSNDAMRRKPFHYAVDYDNPAIAKSHLQYDGFDAFHIIHPDAAGVYPIDQVRSDAMKSVLAQHIPNNPASFSVSRQAFEEAMKDGSLSLEGKDAERYRQAQQASMNIRQPEYIHSAQDGMMQNPVYREAIHKKPSGGSWADLVEYRYGKPSEGLERYDSARERYAQLGQVSSERKR